MYATPTELIAAVSDPQLVADLTGASEPDIAAITRALESASSEIDSYLATRYILPLATVPDRLRELCIDIAFYKLLNFRPLGDIEDTRRRYTDAIKFLERLADGKVSLGLPTSEAASATVAGTDFVSVPSVFDNLGY